VKHAFGRWAWATSSGVNYGMAVCKNCGQQYYAGSDEACLAVRRSILNKSKVEWTDLNCNHYAGCAHNCFYCYARKLTQRFNPDFVWTRPAPVLNAVDILKKEVSRKKAGRVMVCSMTDPYQPLEKDLQLTRQVLEVLLPSKHHVLILTKSDLVTRDYDLIEQHSNVEVGFTITCRDAETNKKYEPCAPPPHKRLNALLEAKERGIKTFVSVEPWIPNITEPEKLVLSLDGLADRWIFGSLNYTNLVPDGFYAERLPALVEFLDANDINYLIKKELMQEAQPQ